MRIFVVADIHGNTRHLETIQRVIRRHRPDLMVAAGDITKVTHVRQTLESLSQLALPILCIRGDSDFRPVEKAAAAYPNITVLSHVAHSFEGFRFFGLNGTLPLPFHNRVCAFEKNAFNTLPADIRGDILVVHPPPHGILDKVAKRFHAGSRNLRRYIDTAHPKLVLCGHIHEQAGFARHGQTVIINGAMGKKNSGALVELTDQNQVRVNLLQSDRDDGMQVHFNTA